MLFVDATYGVKSNGDWATGLGALGLAGMVDNGLVVLNES